MNDSEIWLVVTVWSRTGAGWTVSTTASSPSLQELMMSSKHMRRGIYCLFRSFPHHTQTFWYFSAAAGHGHKRVVLLSIFYAIFPFFHYTNFFYFPWTYIFILFPSSHLSTGVLLSVCRSLLFRFSLDFWFKLNTK